ncbi:hypothetical protein, partial [Neisseria meningitidis]|uniref:hypothetical protein n=1 Tax=Neisseria meningitidis TaxID=487 RepID=UPI0019556FBF
FGQLFLSDKFLCGQVWIPACAGMTNFEIAVLSGMTNFEIAVLSGMAGFKITVLSGMTVWVFPRPSCACQRQVHQKCRLKVQTASVSGNQKR